MVDENVSERNNFTIDKIIEKIIPVIGGILLTVWFGYLLYTNVWVSLALPIRLGLWFFTSLAIVWWGISFSNKWKYFSDIIIGLGILLFYGTLIYGSRTTELASAMIPEVVTLITSLITIFAVAYFAYIEKQK